jgi:NAD(P)H dehydrogenase (quinone)
MSIKIKIIFHSIYGHVYKLAEAIAEGARSVPGTEVEILQVAETLPDSVLEKMGALEAKKAFAHIPIADPKTLAEADGLLFGTGTQHGGQETTLISMQTFLFHQGMAVVGVPYAAQELTNMNEITGGSPYGSGTLAGADGSRQPTANELAIARFQGKHTAQIAAKLAAK